jgi:hypothetical protein
MSVSTPKPARCKDARRRCRDHWKLEAELKNRALTFARRRSQIVVDTRKQEPLVFKTLNLSAARCSLEITPLPGLEELFSVERKSISDRASAVWDQTEITLNTNWTG